MRQTFRLFPLLVLFTTLAVRAEGLHYLETDAVNPAGLLAQPVKVDSPELQVELEMVLRMQEMRSAMEVARAKSEADLTVFAFANVVGDWFTAEKLPETQKIFKKIAKDSKYFSNAAKEIWGRPRPPFVSGKVKPSVEAEKEGSYPSGHATRGILFALLLAEILPAQKTQLLERGQQIGWDRVIAGVHYPSDVTAGRVLGQALFQALKSSPKFETELEKVRQEIQAATKAHDQPIAASAAQH